eukprot:12255158-Alexandrium_andersonii.AAC.1
MDGQEIAKRVAVAKAHLEFMVKPSKSQLERGAHFLHGHPGSATSWQASCLARLLREPGVESGIGRVCRFGMRVPESVPIGVGDRLVRMPTRWASSSPE